MAALTPKLILFSLIILNNYSCILAKNTLISLNEDNWDKMLSGEWMVEFYAPWCPACKALQPVWHDFSGWSSDLGIHVAQVDVTTSPGLSGRFMVTALPTIFHVNNGEFRQFRGGRDKDSLISFIEDKKWKDIDPVPSWKSPGSIQMSVMASFFKLSTVLRGLHSTMVEEYGIPTWGSYVIFAMVTIIVGAFLGLLLVCLIDCIYPPKTARPSPLASVDSAEEGDESDDLIDEGAESQQETQSEAEESQDEAGADGNLDGGVESSPTMRKRRPRKAD